MSETVRSFVAFDIENEAVRNRLAKAQALLIQTGADVNREHSCDHAFFRRH